jgi:AcrR family transcriptional regulator
LNHTVQQRLDIGLMEHLNALEGTDINDVTVEAVAKAAGVSRATAYRYLGSREELLRRAALALVSGHADQCREAVARATIQDRHLQMLVKSPRTAGLIEAVQELMASILLPTLHEGQRAGQVRDDLSADELIAWLLDQLHLLTRKRLTEEQSRQWVQTFVIPVLDPPGNADGRLRSQVRALLDDVQGRLQEVNVSIVAGRYTFRA